MIRYWFIYIFDIKTKKAIFSWWKFNMIASFTLINSFSCFFWKRLESCIRFIFASLLFKYAGEHLWKKEKRFFYFILKALFINKKINFRISDIQIPWRHQMPKHKTRNTFYWITLEVNTVNEIWPVYVMLQKKMLSKNSTKTANWELVPGTFVFENN